MSLLDKLLVTDEIQRVIAEAIEDGDRVYADHSASRIVQTYPKCGLTAGEIAEKIIRAAVDARLTVEMSKSEGTWSVVS
jgi:hypothetical protein